MDLKKFIKHLTDTIKNGEDLEQYKSIMKQYTEKDWKKHKTKPREYSKKKIFANENFDVYVVSWNTGSQVHDHPSGGCIFKVLDGSIIEEVYKDTEDDIVISEKRTFSANDIGFISGDGLHKITNGKITQMSHSLNIYSPPGHTGSTYYGSDHFTIVSGY
jgi:cysteine dioxygenase